MTDAADTFAHLVLPALDAPDAPAEAHALAAHLATHGMVTYDPRSGDVPNSGYIIPTHADRSTALDHPPGADDLHEYLMQHEDALSVPGTVLHAHNEPTGYHMHIATHTQDPAEAVRLATGLKGYQDISTGKITVPTPPGPAKG